MEVQYLTPQDLNTLWSSLTGTKRCQMLVRGIEFGWSVSEIMMFAPRIPKEFHATLCRTLFEHSPDPEHVRHVLRRVPFEVWKYMTVFPLHFQISDHFKAIGHLLFDERTWRHILFHMEEFDRFLLVVDVISSPLVERPAPLWFVRLMITIARDVNAYNLYGIFSIWGTPFGDLLHKMYPDWATELLKATDLEPRFPLHEMLDEERGKVNLAGVLELYTRMTPEQRNLCDTRTGKTIADLLQGIIKKESA